LQNPTRNAINAGRVLFLINGASILVYKFHLVNKHRCCEKSEENDTHKPDSDHHGVRLWVLRRTLDTVSTNEAHHT